MDIRDLTKIVIDFRNQRGWKKYHKQKDAILGLICEAAELAEHFKWHNEKQMKTYIQKYKKEIGEEISDILYWLLLMSYDLKIDVEEAFKEKMKKNANKYPVKKSYGKYTNKK